jgi:hypothetical protein
MVLKNNGNKGKMKKKMREKHEGKWRDVIEEFTSNYRSERQVSETNAQHLLLYACKYVCVCVCVCACECVLCIVRLRTCTS